jgi:putative glycosyltransferase (TIGR04372 family)
MNSQAFNTLRQSHVCAYYFYLLEITSSIAADFQCQAKSLKSRPLDLWIKSLSEFSGLEYLIVFNEILNYFLTSARWNSSSIINIVNDKHLYNTAHCLLKLGLLTEDSLDRRIKGVRRHQNKTIPRIFGPDRDISFGHYTLIIQAVRSARLTSPRTSFIHYRPPIEFTAFPDFYKILTFPTISRFDLGLNLITYHQLLQYYESGGSENCRDYWNNKLLSDYQIQSDNAFLPQTPASINDRKILAFANRGIHSRLAFFPSTSNFHNKYVEDFMMRTIAANRKLICFTPRDSVYSGSGQPWRDTNIDSYQKTLIWLISMGYSIVRLNPVGEPIQLKHEFLLDNVSIKADVPDQFKILKLSTFLFGSSTGSTEYSHQLFNKATLYLDSSVIYNTGALLDALHAPKKLIVENIHALCQADGDLLGQFLFGSCWSYDECKALGLALRDLSADEKLDAVKRFIALLNKDFFITSRRRQQTTLPLQRLLSPQKAYPCMMLDIESFENIKTLIITFLKFKFNNPTC